MLLSRNEELLNKEFKSVAGRELKMWPFSSNLLLQAASEENIAYQEEDKEDAGYTALFAAIHSLIDKTAGFNGCYAACQESFNYYKTIDGVVSDQIQVLGATDASERTRLVQSKQQLQSEFLKEWGPNGTQIRAINDKVNEICKQGSQMFQGIFHAGGDIYRGVSAEIENLEEDIDVLKSYAEALPNKISTRVEMRWNEISNDVIANLRNLKYGIEAHGVEASVGGFGAIKVKEVGGGRSMLSNMMLGVGASSFAASVLATASVICLPILPVVLVGGLIGLITGSIASDHQQALAYKGAMKKFLSETLAECQQKLLFPSSVSQKSQASLFLDSIRRQVSDVCKAMVDEEKARLEAEFADLEAKAKMNVDEAKERISALAAARNGLGEIKTLLLASRDKLVAISEQLQF